jgi:hypothetical protein
MEVKVFPVGYTIVEAPSRNQFDVGYFLIAIVVLATN